MIKIEPLPVYQPWSKLENDSSMGGDRFYSDDDVDDAPMPSVANGNDDQQHLHESPPHASGDEHRSPAPGAAIAHAPAPARNSNGTCSTASCSPSSDHHSPQPHSPMADTPIASESSHNYPFTMNSCANNVAVTPPTSVSPAQSIGDRIATP